MQAVKLVGPGTVELVDVPVPEPGDDEVLVRIGGAGLCHSDLSIIGLGDKWPTFGFTMGHEGAGWVERLGRDVTGLSVGDAVAVHLIWSCGACRPCLEGRDNACRAATPNRLGFPVSPGLGPDGAMADFQAVKARYLQPLGELAPEVAAPLTDAALTPMHAINSARHRLSPGSTVLAIGLGGLGHMGVQILRATTGAHIIAVDTDERKVAHAAELGANEAYLSDEHTAEAILQSVGPFGVDVVLDFVGAQPTLDLGSAVISPDGVFRIVGLGRGVIPFQANAGKQPWSVDFRMAYGGTRADLADAIALAQAGQIGVEVTTYPLADFERAIDDLEHGRVPARAVLVP